MLRSDSQAIVGMADRRTFMKTAAGLAGGPLVCSLLPRVVSAQQGAPSSDFGQTILASSSVANVDTTAGKIRGYVHNDIYTFKGVPYGASAAGEARFVPPSKPTPWTGVRTTLQYGCVCPQRSGITGNTMKWPFSWIGTMAIRVRIVCC